MAYIRPQSLKHVRSFRDRFPCLTSLHLTHTMSVRNRDLLALAQVRTQRPDRATFFTAGVLLRCGVYDQCRRRRPHRTACRVTSALWCV